MTRARPLSLPAMRWPALVVALAAIAMPSGMALAQMDGSSGGSLRCSAIADADLAQAAALIYYVAGYADATRDAQTLMAGGTAEGAAAPGAESAGGAAAGGEAGAAVVESLTLSADAVIEACAQSPDSLIATIITAQGGSGMAPANAPNPTDTATEAPAEQPAAETGGEAAAPAPQQ